MRKFLPDLLSMFYVHHKTLIPTALIVQKAHTIIHAWQKFENYANDPQKLILSHDLSKGKVGPSVMVFIRQAVIRQKTEILSVFPSTLVSQI